MVNSLVLEGDHDYKEVLHALLATEPWKVEVANDVDSAVMKLRDNVFDICFAASCFMDAGEESLYETIRRVSTVPLVALVESHHALHVNRFLDEGADSYILKPFHPRDLRCMARALLRRARLSQQIAESGDELVAHSVRLSIARRQASIRGRVIHLAPREFTLLQTLMVNRGCVLSRSQLATRAWGVEFDGADREVDVYVRRLRNKIEMNPQSPEYLLTERGYGYRFLR